MIDLADKLRETAENDLRPLARDVLVGVTVDERDLEPWAVLMDQAAHYIKELRAEIGNTRRAAVIRVRELEAENARLTAIEAELHLLEEVCAFYANDEDRFLKSDGASEPYGMIPTEVGMKARSARRRFMAREAAELQANADECRKGCLLAGEDDDGKVCVDCPFQLPATLPSAA